MFSGLENFRHSTILFLLIVYNAKRTTDFTPSCLLFWKMWPLNCFKSSSSPIKSNVRFSGDGLSRYNYAPFSTPDKDHTSKGCTESLEAGWWSTNCSGSGLNSLYPTLDGQTNINYMKWLLSDGVGRNVTKVSMKIRRY